MPKLKLDIDRQKSQNGSILNINQNTGNYKRIESKLEIDKLLRRQRSKKYMDAIHKLDAGGYCNQSDKVKEIVNVIREEFPEITINGILVGIIATCYLGNQYEVHMLSIDGEIIEHYKRGQVLPYGLERARSIACRGSYDFIEVYLDCCRAVNCYGDIAVIDL